MIAYLFFHHLEPGADEVEYEAGLRYFHDALRGAGFEGFVGSRTVRTGDGYCDWYLVESSAALDHLNDAAVSGGRLSIHNAVAMHAVNFTGKLMKLTAGRYDPEAALEVRFSKPRGMTYPDLYRRLEPLTARPDVSVWRRMLVLGPGPEFSLLARGEEQLPVEMDPVVVRLEPV
ncbi:MAG TPA: hypothetical protein VFL27_02095 [Candidatus Dormibacteraeota bacterium]|nr:hypothetical protein [Candidatus Dormibacteraeota bacterium]